MFALLVLMTGGCTKNEFRINGRFDDASSAHSLVITYHASDSKKGWVVRFDVPVVNSTLDLTGYTHDPTVVWISSSDGREMTWLLAERGDKLIITGTIDKPDGWKVSGNEADELLSEWRSKNASMLHGAGAPAINSAIAEFVDEHPNSKAAALLLLNTFDRRVDSSLFEKLWKSLGEDADKEAMLKASGIDPADVMPLKQSRVEQLTLYTASDSLETFKTADSRKTVLAFIHGDEPRRAAVTSFMTSIASSAYTRAIEVSFAKDIAYWRHTLPAEVSHSPVIFAWVQGGSRATSLKGLDIGSTPWFVALDSLGRTMYSGPDSTKVRVALKKMK